MELLDLTGFASFIRDRRRVPERNQAYYVSWVRRYLQTEAPAVITSEKDRLRYFCEQPEGGGKNQELTHGSGLRASETIRLRIKPDGVRL